MPILTKTDFKPAWWLRGPHLQTLWPALCRRSSRPRRIREQLETVDGDFVDLDWYGEGGSPIVILLHGLSGSSSSKYIEGMQEALWQRGFRSVALNFRGCSGRPNRTARCYHSGDTEDVEHLYRWLKRQEPTTPLAAVGFSLGGNVLLKWLGEQGKKLDLFAAAAVSVPLQLNLCADRMDRGYSRFYRNHLLRELKHYVRKKRDYLHTSGNREEAEKLMRLGDLSPLQSFWTYDDQVVARLYRFRDVHDYYQQSSSRQYLKAIRIPTLIVQALDDPFMTPDVIPSADELSPHVDLEITQSGGHVGFISGHTPGRPRYWLEERIPAFLAKQFERSSKKNGIAAYVEAAL